MSQLSSKWIYIILALITLLGLQLRLEAVRYTIVDTPIRADARIYLLYAINLKQFHIYSHSPDAIEGKVDAPEPDALCTPGYPLFMRLFLGDSITNKTLLNIELVQALLSTLTILAVYYSFVLMLKPGLALSAALLTAMSPHLVTANVFLLSESLFCFLLMVSIFLLSRWRLQSSPYLLFVTGFVFAMTSLTRPWIQYFIIIMVALLALAPQLPRSKRAALLLISGFLIPMGFWIMRNIITLGILADNSLMTHSLHHGIYPGMMYENNPESLGYPYRFDPRSDEISASLNSVLNEIYNRFHESPFEYIIWYMIGKPLMMFSWTIFEGMGDVFIYPVLKTPYANSNLFIFTHSIMQYLHYWLVGLAGIGCIAIWLPDNKHKLGVEQVFFSRCISILLIYFIVLHSICAPFSRYSIPMRPIVYALAMYGLWYLWNALKPFLTNAISHNYTLK